MKREIKRGGVLGVLLLLAAALLPHAVAANGTVGYSVAANGSHAGNTSPLGPDAPDANVTNVTTAAAPFATVDGTPYFWRSTAGRFDVKLSLRESGVYALCLSPDSDANATAVTCERFNATVTTVDASESNATATRVEADVMPTEIGANATANATDGVAITAVTTPGRPNAGANGAPSNATVVSLAANRTQFANTTSATVALRNATANRTLDAETVGLASKAGDVDGDGLSNERELALGVDVSAADTDGDGLADGAEVSEYGTGPVAPDTDEDGVRDGPEIREYGTDPTDADSDGDGLADGAEIDAGTDPTASDTDGDGLTDARERALDTDPTAVDTDGDGLSDRAEREAGTDPILTDTDADGLDDAAELRGDTSPTVADTDADGLPDGKELTLGTDPLTVDTDADGLADREEVRRFGTDPLVGDTDADFMSDETELKLGTNPASSVSPAWMTGGAFGFLAGVGVTVVLTRRGPAVGGRLGRFAPGFVARAVDSDGRGADVADGHDTDVDEVETADASDSASATTGGERPSPAEVQPSSAAEDRPPSPAAIRPSSAAEVVETAEVGLVSDAELVERMLRAESGRMRQSEIVEVTGWSKAKVSRRLSAMADDGTVTKVQIGRENLICLDDAVPDLAAPGEGPPAGGRGRPGSAVTAGQ